MKNIDNLIKVSKLCFELNLPYYRMNTYKYFKLDKFPISGGIGPSNSLQSHISLFKYNIYFYVLDIKIIIF